MPYATQIKASLTDAAVRNNLDLNDSLLSGLAFEIEAYLQSQGALPGNPGVRVYPAAITGNHRLVRAELGDLASNAGLSLSEQVLDGLATMVEGYLVQNGVLSGVSDPSTSPERRLADLQERIDPIEAEGLNRDYNAEIPFVKEVDETFKAIRKVLKKGAKKYGVNVSKGNLDEMATLLHRYLNEHNLA